MKFRRLLYRVLIFSSNFLTRSKCNFSLFGFTFLNWNYNNRNRLVLTKNVFGRANKSELRLHTKYEDVVQTKCKQTNHMWKLNWAAEITKMLWMIQNVRKMILSMIIFAEIKKNKKKLFYNLFILIKKLSLPTTLNERMFKKLLFFLEISVKKQ